MCENIEGGAMYMYMDFVVRVFFYQIKLDCIGVSICDLAHHVKTVSVFHLCKLLKASRNLF